MQGIIGPSELDSARKRRYALKTKYGITPLQYDALLKRQGGVCSICGTTTSGGNGQFHVDHDHDTGTVRGLLCVNCNKLLGHAYDNVHTLSRAITYLTEPLLDLDDLVEIYGLS